MRHILVLALTFVAAGCGGAPRPVRIAPHAAVTTPEHAAAVARAVLDVRYGVDPASTDKKIVGRTEWFADDQILARKWERGVTVALGGSTWFQAVAVVETPSPGQVAVRVVGRTTLAGGRLDGLVGVVSSGDPEMPLWADVRVAKLQAAINHVLEQSSSH